MLQTMTIIFMNLIIVVINYGCMISIACLCVHFFTGYQGDSVGKIYIKRLIILNYYYKSSGYLLA